MTWKTRIIAAMQGASAAGLNTPIGGILEAHAAMLLGKPYVTNPGTVRSASGNPTMDMLGVSQQDAERAPVQFLADVGSGTGVIPPEMALDGRVLRAIGAGADESWAWWELKDIVVDVSISGGVRDVLQVLNPFSVFGLDQAGLGAQCIPLIGPEIVSMNNKQKDLWYRAIIPAAGIRADMVIPYLPAIRAALESGLKIRMQGGLGFADSWAQQNQRILGETYAQKVSDLQEQARDNEAEMAVYEAVQEGIDDVAQFGRQVADDFKGRIGDLLKDYWWIGAIAASLYLAPTVLPSLIKRKGR